MEAERAGTECSGVEWIGPLMTGAARSGMEWFGKVFRSLSVSRVGWLPPGNDGFEAILKEERWR